MIVIAVVVILIALLLPAVGMARAKARQGKCASNQRQIWMAWTRATNTRTQPVQPSLWPSQLTPYLSNDARVTACPDVSAADAASYGLHHRAHRFGPRDNGRIVLLDYNALAATIVGSTIDQLDEEWPSNAAGRHFESANVTFADGHTVPKLPAQIDPRFCDYYVRYWQPAREPWLKLNNCLALSDLSSGGGSGGDTGAATSETTAGSATATTSGASGSTTGGTSASGGTTSSAPPPPVCPTGRYVKVTLPGTNVLSLAEVQVFDAGGNNVAAGRTATQSSSDPTFPQGSPNKAVDGNTNGAWANGSVTHTANQANQWWMVDLGSSNEITQITVWNRTDSCCTWRLNNALVEILDSAQQPIWSQSLPVMNGVPQWTLATCTVTTGGSTSGGSTTSATTGGPPPGDPVACQNCLPTCAVPNDSYARYKFDNPGNILLEASGGAALTPRSGVVSYNAGGKVGGAASFPGQVFATLDIPSSTRPRTTGPGSISMWFKTLNDNNVNDASLLYYANFTWAGPEGDGWGHVSDEWHFGPRTTGYINHLMPDTNDSDPNTPAGVNQDGTCTHTCDNQWHHVVVTWTATGEGVIYVDGCEESRSPLNPTLHVGIPAVARLGGANGDDSGAYFRWYKGLMDEVRFYNRPLSGCEVRALYQAEGGN
jgi:prepilin-type processing-associated H-X9-DG protein